MAPLGIFLENPIDAPGTQASTPHFPETTHNIRAAIVENCPASFVGYVIPINQLCGHFRNALDSLSANPSIKPSTENEQELLNDFMKHVQEALDNLYVDMLAALQRAYDSSFLDDEGNPKISMDELESCAKILVRESTIKFSKKVSSKLVNMSYFGCVVASSWDEFSHNHPVAKQATVAIGDWNVPQSGFTRMPEACPAILPLVAHDRKENAWAVCDVIAEQVRGAMWRVYDNSMDKDAKPRIVGLINRINKKLDNLPAQVRKKLKWNTEMEAPPSDVIIMNAIMIVQDQLRDNSCSKVTEIIEMISLNVFTALQQDYNFALPRALDSIA
jgi:hypothetical protein